MLATLEVRFGKKEVLRYSAKPFWALQPKRPAEPCRPDRPVRLDQCGLNQLCRSLQDKLGPVVDLVEPFDDAMVQEQKARGSVNSRSPFAVAIQLCKSHSIHSKCDNADGHCRSNGPCQRDRHTAVGRLPKAYGIPIVRGKVVPAGVLPLSTARQCQKCGRSHQGKRSDARFCSASCRVNAHRHEVGRIEAISSGFIIDKTMRDALIEDDRLNPQDEHDPVKVRAAFAEVCR